VTESYDAKADAKPLPPRYDAAMGTPTDTTAEAWPEAGASMVNLTGWGEVDCATRDRFFAEWGDRLSPFSSLTDQDGQYGTPVIYTEWGVQDGEKPWLRDYRYPERGCVHYMPKANISGAIIHASESGT
jgi:hypothetical protein